MFEKLTSNRNFLNPNKLAVRFHDNDGHGIQNLVVALAYNINTIDSSAGGIGSFPFLGIG
jgi:hypothetical protein